MHTPLDKLSIEYQHRLYAFNRNITLLTATMACPTFLIAGQNISLLILGYTLYRHYTFFSPFTFRSWIQLIGILFGLFSIITTLRVWDSPESFSASLAVLPNYIYWGLMLWVLIAWTPYFSMDAITKGAFWGLVSITLVHAFMPFNIPGYVSVPSPNNFSLLLICYSAPAIAYIRKRYSLTMAYITLGIICFLLISDGRRAGTVLTFLSGLVTLALPNMNARNLAVGLITLLLVFGLFQTLWVEDLIKGLSPRVYELIYESESVRTEDRSFLTRKLMVEKGISLYETSPIWGIGLNGFTINEVEFEGDFEGAEWVKSKGENNNLSAHNSYITLLAEGGILQLGCLLVIQFFVLILFVIGYPYRGMLANSILIAFSALSIDLYVITGIVNVHVWYLIGISCAIASKSIRFKLVST